VDDPEAYRREQFERRMPDDFDDLTEVEEQRIIRQLEGEVLSADQAQPPPGDEIVPWRGAVPPQK